MVSLLRWSRRSLAAIAFRGHHEKRAALICLLTAALAAEGTAEIITEA
jgi:hypothetical protein